METEQTLDLVRSSIAAFSDRDLDSLLELLHEDVEYDLTDVLLTGPHRGKESVAEVLMGLWDLLDAMWMEVERIDQVDGDTVVVVVHQGGRGHGSGVEVDARRGHVFTIREGLIWRFKVYADPARALEAVGLGD